MEIDEHQNDMILREFIHLHGLRRSQGGLHSFKCEVDFIELPSTRKISSQNLCEGLITFDPPNTGELQFLDFSYGVAKFPTSFRSKFQNFEIKNNDLHIKSSSNAKKFSNLETVVTFLEILE